MDLLLMEEILHHLLYMTSYETCYILNIQLVQDFFHQQYLMDFNLFEQVWTASQIGIDKSPRFCGVKKNGNKKQWNPNLKHFRCESGQIRLWPFWGC